MTIFEYTDLGFNLVALLCVILLFSIILVVGVYGLVIVIGSIYFDLARFLANKDKWK